MDRFLTYFRTLFTTIVNWLFSWATENSTNFTTYNVLKQCDCSVLVPVPLTVLLRLIDRLHPLDLLLLKCAGDAFDEIATAWHNYIVFGRKHGNVFLLVCPYVQVRWLMDTTPMSKLVTWTIWQSSRREAAIRLAETYENYLLNIMETGNFLHSLEAKCRRLYIFIEWDRGGAPYKRLLSGEKLVPRFLVPKTTKAPRWSSFTGQICCNCAPNLESFGLFTDPDNLDYVYSHEYGWDLSRVDLTVDGIDDFHFATSWISQLLPPLCLMEKVETIYVPSLPQIVLTAFEAYRKMNAVDDRMSGRADDKQIGRVLPSVSTIHWTDPNPEYVLDLLSPPPAPRTLTLDWPKVEQINFYRSNIGLISIPAFRGDTLQQTLCRAFPNAALKNTAIQYELGQLHKGNVYGSWMTLESVLQKIPYDVDNPRVSVQFSITDPTDCVAKHACECEFYGRWGDMSLEEWWPLQTYPTTIEPTSIDTVLKRIATLDTSNAKQYNSSKRVLMKMQLGTNIPISWHSAHLLFKPWRKMTNGLDTAVTRTKLQLGVYTKHPPHVWMTNWVDDANRVLSEIRDDEQQKYRAASEFSTADYERDELFGSHEYTCFYWHDVKFDVCNMYATFYAMLNHIIENRVESGRSGRRTFADAFYSNLSSIEFRFEDRPIPYPPYEKSRRIWWRWWNRCCRRQYDAADERRENRVRQQVRAAQAKMRAILLGIEPPSLPDMFLKPTAKKFAQEKYRVVVAELDTSRDELYRQYNRCCELLKQNNFDPKCGRSFCALPKLQTFKIIVGYVIDEE